MKDYYELIDTSVLVRSIYDRTVKVKAALKGSGFELDRVLVPEETCRELWELTKQRKIDLDFPLDLHLRTLEVDHTPIRVSGSGDFRFWVRSKEKVIAMIDVKSLIDAVEKWCAEPVPRRELDEPICSTVCPCPSTCHGCGSDLYDAKDLITLSDAHLCQGCVDAVIRLRPLLRRMGT